MRIFLPGNANERLLEKRCYTCINKITKKNIYFLLKRLTFLQPTSGSTRQADNQICSLLFFSAVDSFIHAFSLYYLPLYISRDLTLRAHWYLWLYTLVYDLLWSDLFKTILITVFEYSIQKVSCYLLEMECSKNGKTNSKHITVSVDTDCFVVGFSNIETKFNETYSSLFQIR